MKKKLWRIIFLVFLLLGLLWSRKTLLSDKPVSAQSGRPLGPVGVHLTVSESSIDGDPVEKFSVDKFLENPIPGIQTLVVTEGADRVKRAHDQGYSVLTFHIQGGSEDVCRATAQIGADAFVTDEIVWGEISWGNDNNVAEAVSIEKAIRKFNACKNAAKEVNPNILVGDVEPFWNHLKAFMEKGAKPDFVGGEVYNGDITLENLNQLKKDYGVKTHQWLHGIDPERDLKYIGQVDFVVFGDPLGLWKNHCMHQDCKPYIEELRKWAASQSLTCNYPWAAIPPATHILSKETSDVKVNLGFSSTFGGVGVKFELINKENNSSIDILEARSGAGAGWQYTGMITPYSDEGGLINQACGNGVGYQWGYSNNLRVSKADGVTTLFSLDWAPNYSDNWGPRGTSPCPNTDPAVVFDEGKPEVTAKLADVSNGSVIHITSSYKLRSLIDQFWKVYVPAQAFYLNRGVARQHSLRFYLFGKTGWKEGPIYLYDDYTVKHGVRIENPNWGPTYGLDESIKQALFVWDVNGKDIGVLVFDIPRGASIRMSKDTYCGSAIEGDLSCGSIDLITNDNVFENVSFPKGQERTYSYDYVVGTVEQLAEYGGFTLPTSLSFKKPVTASSTHAASNTQYAVDGNLNTAWNAGTGVTPSEKPWVEVDLGTETTVNGISAVIDQNPNGQSEHEVAVAGNNKVFTPVYTFNGYTMNNSVIEKSFPTPLTGVRYVKITTKQSPSWVAWREINVFGSLPEDLNNDGQVNSQDLIILLQNWGSSPANPKADLNSDGVVNGFDFEKLRKLIP